MKLEMGLLASIITAAVLLGGCHKSDLIQPPGGEMYIRFVDNGAVVPNPVITTVMVEPDKISGNSSQDGTPVVGWASTIDSKDYQRLVRIAIDNNLSRGPSVPVGQGACVGSREMLVVITVDGLAHTITVPGLSRCDTSAWPAGLGSLVSLKDSLVTKYHR